VVLGGTSLFGGRGLVLGTLVGALSSIRNTEIDPHDAVPLVAVALGRAVRITDLGRDDLASTFALTPPG
jgi:hypothetical protein